MRNWVDCAAVLAFMMMLVHLVSVVVAAWRCRRISRLVLAPDLPRVALIRPICGLENNLEATLRSSFALDYPDYEVIFCVAAAEDAAAPIVRRLIAAYPHVPTRLLVGNETISDNPKLNNVAKGWRATAADWIVIADSNVLMPPDYLQCLLTAFRPDTGLVCSPATGGDPDGFPAELECAFLNTHQVRWQYTADTFGCGFAQGKSMLFRRAAIEKAGGIRALATDLAEDAAATKVIRAAGLRVRLVDAPFIQPLGVRTLREVWNRQVRWARLRRASFSLYFVPEIFTSGLWPLLTVVLLAASEGISFGVVPICAVVWYGGEAVLARIAGWPLTWRSPLAWMLRDLLLPAIWINGWFDASFVWRGNEMRVGEPERAG